MIGSMSGGKGVTTLMATAVALGAIIGAGIFVLSGTAIAVAGSYAIIAFIVVGIIAFFVALQLGELGSLMPSVKGGAYSYVYGAFGSELGFITGIILYFSYSTGISVISLGFGSYLASLLGLSVGAYQIYFAIMLIVVLSIVNLAGIKKAIKSDSVLVLLKIAILVLFVAFALVFAYYHSAALGANFVSLPSQTGLGAIFAASVVIFFAYSGFQSISTFTSRIQGGARAAAKALAFSVLISIALYVLIAFALIALVPASRYTAGGDPLAFALQAAHAPDYLFILVAIGAIIATVSASLANMLGSSRMLYQISADRLLPEAFRKYNRSKDVAVNGVIVSAVIAIVMLFSGNIYVIASISNFGLLFSFLMVSLAVIHFRRLGRKGEVRTPFYPYIPLITIIGLLAFMSGMPQEALVVGVLIVMVLIMAYYSLREIESKKVIRVKLFK